jgi:hypothetical protein
LGDYGPVEMQPPIDGPQGALWRGVTWPLRAAAPLGLLARRAVTGNLWAETVTTRAGPMPLPQVSDAPDVQPPESGAGPVNHRTYRVEIVDSPLTPEALVEMFRCDPNRFVPTSYATFSPDPAPDGLATNDRAEVKIPGPWDGPVRVAAVTDTSLRLETLVGHMEAGWIDFSCAESDGALVFTIESFARSGDPVFDALYHSVGIAKLVQSEMWVQVLESIVEASGGRRQGRLALETTIHVGAIT